MAGWEPFTQTLAPGDSTSGVINLHALLQVVTAKVTGGVLTDGTAQSCCWAHVLDGRPMSFAGWLAGSTACPVTPPGLSKNGVIGAPIYGTGMVVRATVGSSPDYAITGGMEYLSVAADTTLGTSSTDPLMPSWANPYLLRPSDPPPVVWNGTQFIHYLYQPFTSIEIDVTIAEPAVADAFAQSLTVRRRAYGDPPWTTGGAPGVPVMSMTAPIGGPPSWSGSDVVPDPIAGATYAVGTSLLTRSAPAPGMPWGSGAGLSATYVTTAWRVTVRRQGMRRTGVAPPLHQRRRTDGLGGGPMHQSPGLVSRQLGGRARGIY